MPSPSRLSEEQFCHLAWLARPDCSLNGRLHIRVNENPAKWQLKWFTLYQNFLFYFENEDTTKLSGLIYLEHSMCERVCVTNLKDIENQVSGRQDSRYRLLFKNIYHNLFFASNFCLNVTKIQRNLRCGRLFFFSLLPHLGFKMHLYENERQWISILSLIFYNSGIV